MSGKTEEASGQPRAPAPAAASASAAVPRPWQEIAAKTQAARFESIPAEWRLSAKAVEEYTKEPNANVTGAPRDCGLLTAQELDITEEYDAIGLLEKIKSKEFSAVQVTTAFCERAAIAQQLVNCCTEMFFDIALERARFLDEYLAKEGKPLGPLHGLPVSVKDLYNITGVRTTSCFISQADQAVSTTTSSVVASLQKLGAVFYVKTNMTQLGAAFDTDNNLFGRTLNPLNISLGSGGSSGGESALIAMRGSIVGIGTDALGSLRSPAIATGIFTIKPTTLRFPHGGTRYSSRGVPTYPPHSGPLCVSIRDLELIMREVLNSDPWRLEPTLISVPWHESQSTLPYRPLRIGFFTEDPSSSPLHPPMLRALTDASATLAKAGHTILPLSISAGTFPSLHRIRLITSRYRSLDTSGTARTFVTSSNEPWVPSVTACGTEAQKAITSYISTLPTGAQKAHGEWQPSLPALFALNAQREDLAAQMAKTWSDLELDVVLMPGSESTAPPHDTWTNGAYLAIWNALGYPACVMPYSKAAKEKDREFLRSGEDGIVYASKYDPDAIEGMPCGIQLVGRPMQDEKLLAVAAVMGEVLGI